MLHVQQLWWLDSYPHCHYTHPEALSASEQAQGVFDVVKELQQGKSALCALWRSVQCVLSIKVHIYDKKSSHTSRTVRSSSAKAHWASFSTYSFNLCRGLFVMKWVCTLKWRWLLRQSKSVSHRVSIRSVSMVLLLFSSGSLDTRSLNASCSTGDACTRLANPETCIYAWQVRE